MGLFGSKPKREKPVLPGDSDFKTLGPLPGARLSPLLASEARDGWTAVRLDARGNGHWSVHLVRTLLLAPGCPQDGFSEPGRDKGAPHPVQMRLAGIQGPC